MSDSEDSGPSEVEYTRDNRKRPREFSTKAPVARASLIISKKKVRYDPRFECGEFDRVQFNRDYSFIDDMRRDELKQMKKSVRKEQDPNKAGRMPDETNAEIEARAELRQQNIKRMNEGSNPIYLNRNQFKSKVMEKRFEKIKAKGGMKKYLKKRKVKAFKKGLDVE
ncbi:Ribosomal RNA processing protein 36-like protein, protein [Aphelenchoides bicaudatus]|nr:Ribosomal RNA processing protein 36-like protein, protein [Aphelenchoides bicaudatus]